MTTGEDRLPNGVNYNTLWIVGVGLLSIGINWGIFGTRLSSIEKTLNDFKSEYASKDELTNAQTTLTLQQQNLTAQIQAVAGSVATLTQRMDLISDRVVDGREKQAVADNNLSNLERTVEELRKRSITLTPSR